LSDPFGTKKSKTWAGFVENRWKGKKPKLAGNKKRQRDAGGKENGFLKIRKKGYGEAGGIRATPFFLVLVFFFPCRFF